MSGEAEDLLDLTMARAVLPRSSWLRNQPARGRAGLEGQEGLDGSEGEAQALEGPRRWLHVRSGGEIAARTDAVWWTQAPVPRAGRRDSWDAGPLHGGGAHSSDTDARDARDAADAEGLELFLGAGEGETFWARRWPQDEPELPEGVHWADVKNLGLSLEPSDLAAAVTAVGLARWHEAHSHCSRCGAPTLVESRGWVRRCPVDESHHFPRTDPAVIMAITDPQDRLLLARGSAWPKGRMSVLAGFVEPGESLEAAVARETYEEVGVEVEQVHYLGSQPWPFPASIMMGFRARAVAPPQSDANPSSAHLDNAHPSAHTPLWPDHAEIAEAQWVSREDLTDLVRCDVLRLPGRLSIARHLIEHWYGGPLPVVRERSGSIRD